MYDGSFKKGANKEQLPEFPLTKKQLETMPVSMMVDPCEGQMHGVALPERLSTAEGRYEAAMEVVSVVQKTSRGEFPAEFMTKWHPAGREIKKIPEALAYAGFQDSDPQQLAIAVHMDLPWDFPSIMLRWLMSGQTPLKRLPHDHSVFQSSMIHPMEDMLDHIKLHMKKGFDVKYFHGIARPEEALEYNCTIYPEGSPTHPSFVAGHACAASCVYVLMKKFDLDDDIKAALEDAAYVWAMSRSLAGVHYPEDNVEGLKLGKLFK